MLYRQALHLALHDEMKRDERVIVLGEDVGAFGGTFRVTEGLFGEYGEDRVIDTPIAELSIVGNAIGMAIAGLRPVVELMTANFSLLAFDQIINHMSKIPYMSAGKIRLPMVIRMPQGVSRQLGAQHSENYEQMLSAVPGIFVFAVADPHYAYHALKQSIQMDDPVIFIEHELLYNKKAEVDVDTELNPFKARLVKEGNDITIISYLKMLDDTLECIDEIETTLSCSCEVIDLCSLNPIDFQSLEESIRKTGRVVLVEEGHKMGSFGAQVISWAAEELFYLLDAPPLRISGENVPIAYNRRLELASIPTPETITKEIIQWGRRSGL